MGALVSVSGPRREPGTGYQTDLSLSLRPFITPLLRHSVTLKG
jgi:hypothetical protein